MKTFWLGWACFVACAIAVWFSQKTYGQLTGGQPMIGPQHPKMISLDNAIVDANEILFVDETPTDIRVAFRGLPMQGNGPYTVLFLRRTAENWRKLADATGVTVPPRATTTPENASHK